MGNPKAFCDQMDAWAKLCVDQGGKVGPAGEGFKDAWSTVRLAIGKYMSRSRRHDGDEQPSQTPCPVHKGKWSGCHFRWPGRVWVGMQGDERGKAWFVDWAGSMEKGWYDAGCRCAYHKCGCTTGWQPDEHLWLRWRRQIEKGDLRGIRIDILEATWKGRTYGSAGCRINQTIATTSTIAS